MGRDERTHLLRFALIGIFNTLVDFTLFNLLVLLLPAQTVLPCLLATPQASSPPTCAATSATAPGPLPKTARPRCANIPPTWPLAWSDCC